MNTKRAHRAQPLPTRNRAPGGPLRHARRRRAAIDNTIIATSQIIVIVIPLTALAIYTLAATIPPIADAIAVTVLVLLFA